MRTLHPVETSLATATITFELLSPDSEDFIELSDSDSDGDNRQNGHFGPSSAFEYNQAPVNSATSSSHISSTSSSTGDRAPISVGCHGAHNNSTDNDLVSAHKFIINIDSKFDDEDDDLPDYDEVYIQMQNKYATKPLNEKRGNSATSSTVLSASISPAAKRMKLHTDSGDSSRMIQDNGYSASVSATNTYMSDAEYAQQLRAEEEASIQLKDEEEFKKLIEVECTCLLCGKLKEQNSICMIDECSHHLCTTCVAIYIRRLLRFSKSTCVLDVILCPCHRDSKSSLLTEIRTKESKSFSPCTASLPDWIIKLVITNEEYQTVSTRLLRLHLQQSGLTFVKCPKCKEEFERIPTDLSLSTTSTELDDNGNPLSLAHRHHKQEHRYRCPSCATIFCSSCDSVPYHLGYSCDEWEIYRNARHCRFCSDMITDSRKKVSIPTCTKSECTERAGRCCTKKLLCGHSCAGIRRERKCPPCLQEDCKDNTVNVNAEDFCTICYSESLYAAPCIQLDCGHIFHQHCITSKLTKQWPGSRMTFSFLNCSVCSSPISHPSLTSLLDPLLKLRESVKSKALLRLHAEELDKCDALTNPTSRYYRKPTEYAMDSFAYYPCSRCNNPYFGGRRNCEEAQRDDLGFDKSQLVCPGCVVGEEKICKIHGKESLEYKCKFCCQFAAFYCWGTTHFCQSCHQLQVAHDYVSKKPLSELPKCKGKNHCPVGGKHPPNGTVEFCLGCGMCRSDGNL